MFDAAAAQTSAAVASARQPPAVRRLRAAIGRSAPLNHPQARSNTVWLAMSRPRSDGLTAAPRFNFT
jgi:hypothetical protein